MPDRSRKCAPSLDGRVWHEQDALKFAVCMPNNGVPSYPDPQFGASGGILAKLPRGVNTNSPTFEAVAKKCNA
jgi:hypothetical protein